MFAAQPCTWSITPRRGSTARSGSRLFEETSKRREVADPKLDGRRQTRIDLGPCFRKEIVAPAVRLVASIKEATARGVGRWRRKPHARESDALWVHGL